VDEIVHWLNTNSGAVQAFAVLALVVITAVYAYFTKRMASEMRDQTLAQDRPDLLIDIEKPEVLEWRRLKELDEEWASGPWLYVCPASLTCRVHNAGRHAAKEVRIGFRHPSVAFQIEEKGFLLPGETWVVRLEADPIIEREIDDLWPPEIIGLREWLKRQGQGHTEDDGDAGVIVFYCDIHDKKWATYLALDIWLRTDATAGEARRPDLYIGPQRLIRPKA
jgi:hypothetical protein